MKINPLLISFLTLILLNSCSGIPEALKPKPVDAREISPNAKDRVDKNMAEGRGMRLFGGKKGGEFEFANSNSLWRGALETIDFMPLLSVDYGGGIIITDWFSDSADDNESIKLVIKFLSNEIRADALDIKVFKKVCSSAVKCKTISTKSNLDKELKLTILKKAAIYEKNKFAKQN
jgi:hypothetical protein